MWMHGDDIVVSFCEIHQRAIHRILVTNIDVEKMCLASIKWIFCGDLETVVTHVTFREHGDARKASLQKGFIFLKKTAGVRMRHDRWDFFLLTRKNVRVSPNRGAQGPVHVTAAFFGPAWTFPL